MVALRRSSRQQVKPKRQAYKDDEEVDGSEEEGGRDEYGEEDDDDDDQSAGLSDTSEDEWIPPSKKQQKSSNGNGKKRALPEESDSDSSEGDIHDFENDDEEIAKTSKKSNTSANENKKRKVTLKRNANKPESQVNQQNKSPIPQPQSLVEAEAAGTAENESDDETTRAEAKRLWEEFRSRKKNKDSSKSNANSVQNKPPGGLDQWLGIKPPAWPSTCPEAMINDRDSLFVGFVYALSAPSQAEITHCLSHLSKVVQPQQIPTDRLPPAMQHLAPNRRGATHDMYAWRCLALKRGRDGLGGPEDFGLEEGQEDDGEKYGAKEIAKAIKMYGATDVLVIVSRWYGGTMLGPARFRHIEECAKAALARHMVNEAMVELRTELMELDEKINMIRSQRDTTSSPSISSQTPAIQKQKSNYDDLTDPERAQRLIMARKKQIELLQKSAKKQSISSQQPAPPLQPHLQEEGSAIDEMNAAEEEAALEVMREMEREEVLTQRSTDDANGTAPNADAQDKESGKGIEVTIPIKTEEDESSNVVVKEEPSDNASPQLNASKSTKNIQSPTVKEEMEDDADLAGWDAL
ncbi:hypothetical protein L7F22_039160 [Adiantum nelumboides]|nr:hypothetical protein [Adiantum nelumboides]